MENKKPNKKLIISVIALLALCALIVISVICIKQFNTNYDTTTSSYTNGTGQTNVKKNDNIENKTSENNEVKDNNENNNNIKKEDEDISNVNNNVTEQSTLSQNTNAQDEQTSSNIQSQGVSESSHASGGISLGENSSTPTSVADNGNQFSSNNSVTRYTQDEDGDYTTKVEIETRAGNSEITEDRNYQPSTPEYNVEDDASNKSHTKKYDNWNLTVKDNDYSNLSIKINLLNAPYNNSEYCEEMLKQNYVIKLIEKPENSECNSFPESITINNDGNLNVDTHIYAKSGNLDFSSTYFSELGDYVFGIYPQNSSEELYQVIVTLRGITTKEGYITGKTYSLIQIKSLLKNGEKVDNIDINIENPNTCITIEKQKEKNSFWEKVYVDLYIDSYENEKYTVLDGNALEESLKNSTELSSVKIGNHYVVRNDNGIIPQTYKIADDGKVIVGRKYIGPIASICKIASVSMPKSLGIEKQDLYEIPAGTKYKAVLSSGKLYKEKYEVDFNGELRVAKEKSEDNKIIITNLTGSNPKTGIFYTVVPFVIILVIATVGVIVIKKTSYKNDDDDEDNNE